MNLTFKISAEEQRTFLEACAADGKSLPDELEKRGLGFDDMRYISNPVLPIPVSRQEWLDDIRRIPNNIPAISFFAGAGGFDVGFYCAGYDNLASIEINRIFCDTLRRNFPHKLVIGPPDFSGDVRDRQIIAEVLQRKLSLQKPFDGVFHGGPPCQSFSIAANQRFSKNGENFKRVGFDHQEYGNLLFDYLWFILEFRPKVFILENVAGFMEMDGGQQVKKAVEMMESAGYVISKPQVFNLADFGVPQQRNRFVLVGSRTGRVFRFPDKQRHHIPCVEIFKKNLVEIPNHETREHKAESLLRYMQLEYGKRDKLGRVDRLNPTKPAKTVIAGGMQGGGRSHLHPFIPRTLSVRESARLQTFPDWYVFTGAIARQFTQVGNAVPPFFAYKLAMEINKQFFSQSFENEDVELTNQHEPTLFDELLSV